MGFWRRELIQPALDRDVQAEIAEQQAILERDPGNASAHFALGTLAHFQGATDSAVAFFRKAIELDPTYAAPRVSLGRICVVLGRDDEAWEHARAAARLGDRSLVEQLARHERKPDGQ
ncbi:MAG TPA: tetratricopeptide repeat protein [Terriglobia bacterium]|nr:tetratricopeptide repeat protein [Terriglobia bacterium]